MQFQQNEAEPFEKVPEGQSHGHPDCPVIFWYVPAGQPIQMELLLVVFIPPKYPAGQLEQVVFPKILDCPIGHTVQTLTPILTEYLPPGQSLQFTVPSALEYVPATHAKQTVELRVLVKSPKLHCEHVDTPVELENLPCGHGKQEVSPVTGE
jgi:hypothetical protein